jgi:hypothetical protein
MLRARPRLASLLLVSCTALACGGAPPLPPQAVVAGPARGGDAAVPITLSVDLSKTVRTIDKKRFLGSNIAIWHKASTFESPETVKRFTDAGIGLLRMPGGSAADRYFWNGNGVRHGSTVDRSKYKDGKWEIDYSSWSPGFLGYSGFPKNPDKAELGTWHGNMDVRQQHEFIRRIGAEALVTVNAGIGTPRDAAEWVKWANGTMKYGVTFWEIGNELGGGWESGTLRPDGKTMDGPMYGGIYEAFAKAMKAADPHALVGSQGGVDFIKGALSHKEAPIDFVTYHDYFNAEGNTPEARYKTLDKIKPAIREVKDAIAALRPGEKILVGMTEFNCKLHEDENTADVNSGLWVLAALGEMMYGGLDFATQWDTFTNKKDQGGGHGFLIEEGVIPKAEYWSYVILHRYFGSDLVDVRSDDPDVRAYASIDKEGNAYLLAVNTNQTKTVDAKLEVKGKPTAGVADCVRFSDEEYAWDPVGFAPLWNNGPTPMTLQVAGGLSIGPATALACKLGPPSAGTKLATQGPTTTAIASGGRAPDAVVAGPNATVKARTDGGFAVEPPEAKSGQDGIARFTVTAPKGKLTGLVTFTAAGQAPLAHPLSSVEPEIIVYGPARLPAGETARFIGAARYEDAGTYKLLSTFAGPATLAVAGGPPTSVVFAHGLTSFTLSSPTGARRSIELSSAGITGKTDITFFEHTAKEKVVLDFNDKKSLAHADGKFAFKINENVRANQGVLEISLDKMKGWTQDVVNFDKLKETPGLVPENIKAVFFDVMVDGSFDAAGAYADLIVVLQSELNYWMPLEKVPLATLKKGEWKRVRLAIDKPEWQKAMKAFFKIITVVNSGAELKGKLYLDNLGFVVEAPK